MYYHKSFTCHPHVIHMSSTCCSHVQGLLYLYSHGFPPLGHVQTGNIFVDGDVCKLGGYENTLLGYKTRSYKQCRNHVDSIDLILFGKDHQDCGCKS